MTTHRREGASTTTIRTTYTAVILSGAVFGLFYAWVCTTMWGLDNADPRVAIAAMQAMNASVRNAVFFPAFFLTPVALGAAAVLLRRDGLRRSSTWFAGAAIVYFGGGLLLTMLMNVPMNEDLALITVPSSFDDAQQIWQDYSGRWQFWNATRTAFCGIALLMAAIGLRQTTGRDTSAAPVPLFVGSADEAARV